MPDGLPPSRETLDRPDFWGVAIGGIGPGHEGYKGERLFKTERGARNFAQRVIDDPEWGEHPVWLVEYMDRGLDRGLWVSAVRHHKLSEGAK